ncbi:DUF2931 family protein [Hymenobacter terrenus]|uniref:DUF2931 family protein n=1 Tax=Hymenobacter terrenus TaxID=1629124 RepID=UPI000619B37D|nr:DUF2931 family protein [Hymenobacter terrenus]
MLRSLLTRWLTLGALLPATSACAQRLPASKHMSLFQTEKFLLTAGPCAADGYSVTIQGGAFRCSDGSILTVPAGHVLEGNWGASGTTWSSGDDRHPAPEQLSLTWFSYAEDTFYKGTFLLPQEKIYQLLKQGSWDIEKQKQVTFNRLTVCVLPKGVVVVWLTGGNQVLVGRFQAAPFTPSAEQYQRYYGPADRTLMVKNIRARMPATVQAEIKAGTLSTTQWDEWLKTYPWQVAFAQPLTLYRYAAYYTSAERTLNPLTRQGMDAYRDVVLTPSPKPLPRKLYFYGQTPHKARYLVSVAEFDQAELHAAVEQLLKEHPAAPLTFFFAIDKPYQKATLSLKNEWREIPLIKAPVEVLPEN